jgi:hypothetical protein
VATLTEKPTEIIEAWCGMRDRAVVDEDEDEDDDDDRHICCEWFKPFRR